MIDLKAIISQDFDLKDYRGYSKGVVHDSLVIDYDKNKFYWNSLGISGDAIDWLTEVKGLSRYEALEYAKKFKVQKQDVPEHLAILPESPIYQKLLDVFFESGKSHRDYWYKRGYNDETIEHFKLGYTGKCYVIPIVFEGILYNFQCRTPDKRMWGWTRGLGILPFNFDILSKAEYVVVTESPVNAIAMYQYGYDAVAQNSGAGSWRNWWTVYFNKVKNITIAYDHDLAGYHGAERVAKVFKDRSRILVWPDGTKESYDLNDLLKDGKTKVDVTNLFINNTYALEQFKLFRYFEGVQTCLLNN